MPESADTNAGTPPRHAPIRVALLGSEGAGKTCFLAGLAVLLDPTRPHGPLTVVPNDKGTVSYLRELAATLRGQSWPPSTTMTSLLTVCVGVDGYAIDVLVIDYPGEDFREALGKLDHDKVGQLYDHFLNSDAVLLLFDPDKDVRAVTAPEAREDRIERQLAHLQAVGEVWRQQNRSPDAARLPAKDVAVVVTKSDTVPGLTDGRKTREFFLAHAGGLDARIHQLADEVEYFPMSAIGRSETIERDGRPCLVPAAELTPTGYAEVFRWIVARHRRRKNRQARRLLTAAVTVVAIGAVLAVGIPHLRQRAEQVRTQSVVNDPGRSPTEIIEETRGVQDPGVKQSRRQLIEEQVAELQRRLAEASNEPAVEEVLGRLQKLREAEPGVVESSIDALMQQARQKKEDMLLERVQLAFDAKSTDFARLAHEFLDKYPQSRSAAKVRTWLSENEARGMSDERQAINQIRIYNAASLNSKSDRIVEFLTRHPSQVPEVEAKRMRRAAELAKQFSEVKTYTVTLRSSGGFVKARYQGVWLYVGGALLREYDSPGNSKVVTWTDSQLQFQWTAGQTVKAVLRDRNWGDENVATISDESPLALRLLGRRQALTQFERGWEQHCQNPHIHFEVKDLSEDDWKALELYILPGDAW